MWGRKRITPDMLEAAKEKGWNITQTARHYGMHRTSIGAACERFGIELAQSKFNPQMPSTRSRFWKDVVESPKPKTKAIFSCNPAAVDKALKEHEKKKKMLIANR